MPLTCPAGFIALVGISVNGTIPRVNLGSGNVPEAIIVKGPLTLLPILT